MVLHTLRYRSQVTTGLAFLLAFLTLTISQVTVYSLIAGVILALGLVVIVGRMQWFELEIFGIAAADPGAGKELREHALVRAHWFDDAAQPLTSDSGTIR